ncbi:MAG: hypothetical protein HQL54_07460 [Magnetococcales bacterium]|nr:hypothetical protein [Magnetococcales bacterium]
MDMIIPKTARFFKAFCLMAFLSLLLQGCTSTPSEIRQRDTEQNQAKHHSATKEHGMGGTGMVVAERGMGGTGMVVAERGMGGTGRYPGERGMGGTGITASAEQGMGGTGIIGTLTQFGSVWVNGLHIHYQPDTDIVEDGAPVDVNRLQLGQLLVITAVEQQGKLMAVNMAIHHEVMGPVQQVDTAQKRVTILGQHVDISSLSDQTGTQKINPGQWLAVSGLRHPSGTIMASQLEEIEAGSPLLVRGVVDTISEDKIALGDLSVQLRKEDQISAEPGDSIILRGEMTGEDFSVHHVQKAPARPFGADVTHFVVQGFRSSKLTGAILHAGPMTLPLDQQSSKPVFDDQQGDGQLMWLTTDGQGKGIVHDARPLDATHAPQAGQPPTYMPFSPQFLPPSPPLEGGTIREGLPLPPPPEHDQLQRDFPLPLSPPEDMERPERGLELRDRDILVRPPRIERPSFNVDERLRPPPRPPSDRPPRHRPRLDDMEHLRDQLPTPGNRTSHPNSIEVSR